MTARALSNGDQNRNAHEHSSAHVNVNCVRDRRIPRVDGTRRDAKTVLKPAGHRDIDATPGRGNGDANPGADHDANRVFRRGVSDPNGIHDRHPPGHRDSNNRRPPAD